MLWKAECVVSSEAFDGSPKPGLQRTRPRSRSAPKQIREISGQEESLKARIEAEFRDWAGRARFMLIMILHRIAEALSVVFA